MDIVPPDFDALPANDEPVTVFATQTNHYYASGDARERPFMPSAKHGNKTSSTRIFGMDDDEIWQWAEDNVKNKKITNIRGRINFLAKDVYDNALTFEPDNTPERHANIDGWSDDKQANKDKALQLAAESIFCCQVEAGGFVATACQNSGSGLLLGSFEDDGITVLFSSETVKGLPQAMHTAIGL